MRHEVIPQNLAIKAMRDSGYRDAAHAVAELIDNSIQAGQEKNLAHTDIEVLCIDRVDFVQKRQRRRIDSLAVLDNASGMDRETLRIALQFGNGTHLDPGLQEGIGKFGMGLPNASISQCRRVDVWTWRDGRCWHSHLDVDEIQAGAMTEVPEPQEGSIPRIWHTAARQKIGDHGTLIVWSRLDRVRWKSSKALLENSEAVVGRMYRYVISNGSATIRLASFELNGESPVAIESWDVRPNDPLYLMTNTSAPAPYDRSPAFDLVLEETVPVKYDREDHVIMLRFSVTKPGPREEGGSTAIGHDAAKNQGVSVVRAHREIEMNRTFDDRSDTRERWWGVEVLFEPALDEVFGVTNNKQEATAFYQMSLDQDAELLELTPQQYREQLAETADTRLVIYEISQKISKTLNDTIRPQVRRMREGARSAENPVAPPGSAEQLATDATKRRRERFGDKGQSDILEKLPEEERREKIKAALVEMGEGEQQAEEKAIALTKGHIKFFFEQAEIPGAVIFDIKSEAGVLIIKINSRHPAKEHFIELLQRGDDAADSPALKGLKLLLSAWGRLEDEAGDTRRRELEDIRSDWGRLARDFFEGFEG